MVVGQSKKGQRLQIDTSNLSDDDGIANVLLDLGNVGQRALLGLSARRIWQQYDSRTSACW